MKTLLLLLSLSLALTSAALAQTNVRNVAKSISSQELLEGFRSGAQTIEITSTGTLKWNSGATLTNASAFRTSAGLVIGTDVMAYTASSATPSANALVKYDSSGGITKQSEVATGETGVSDVVSLGSGLITFRRVGFSAYSALSVPGRNTSGRIYSLPDVAAEAVNIITDGNLSDITSVGTITSGTWNGTAIAVAKGGTGSTTASDARTALGLAIGTDVQPYNATLAAIAGGTWTGATSITTLGTITSGTWTGTTIAVANGGTGSTTAANARTALGLAIGTDVQPYNASLAAIAGGTWTGATSITTLGTITSGTWTGTAIAVANGGTGQTSFTDGQLLIGNTGTGGLSKATLTAGSGVTITNGSGTITIAAAGGTAANPTASVGLTAVNGAASTYMRSDAAPALDVGIAPTWTGRHVFSAGGAASLSAVKFSGAEYTGGTSTTTKPLVLIESASTTNNWNTSGTTFGVNQSSNVSTSANVIDLQRDGSRLFSINGSGSLTASACSAVFSNVAVNSNSWLGWTSRAWVYATADGIISMRNNAENGFTRLCLGPATSSHPALAKNGAGLKTVLADASANCALETGALTVGSGGSAITKVLTATGTLDYDLTVLTVEDKTLTVTGAAVGDVVVIGVPNGSVTTSAEFTGWVSATNTVTIRCRTSATGENPASGTFRATVIQH